MRWIAGLRASLACLFTLIATAASAQPETRGPYMIQDYAAGRIDLAGASIPVRVFYPGDRSGVAPVVAVVHGFSRSGLVMAEMARTLASRGFVALVPDLPCNANGCDHQANANQILALLEWGAAESNRAGSQLLGRVDGTRRGAIGHSWGGLATHLATTRPSPLTAAVMLDPFDDRREAQMAAPNVRVPTAHLTAEVGGPCNGDWGMAVFLSTPPPHFRLRVRGSGHCDAEEPSDRFCPLACGSGDPAKSAVFRRYAVAWMSCWLTEDAEVAPYLGGASLEADRAGGAVDQIVLDGAESLPCRAGLLPDAGTLSDAAASADAGATLDGGLGTADGEADAGCGCTTARKSRGGVLGAFASFVVLIAVRGLRRLRPSDVHAAPAADRAHRGGHRTATMS